MLLLTGPSPRRPGGVATFVRSLTEALTTDHPRLDWDLFATDKRGGSPAGRLAGGLAVAVGLAARLRRRRPGLVHLCCGSDRTGWGLREAAIHASLARRSGARVLLHLHASGFEHLWTRRLERIHIQRTLGLADGVAVLSPGQRRGLIERGLTPERVFVIPNGVRVPPLAPPPRRVPTRDAPLRLLLVGSVEERKGVGELLDALQEVRIARGPVVEVDVLGPTVAPPERIREWRRRGEPLGLWLRGSVPAPDIPARLADCDGLVLPSHAEGLPFALLEAMAASRPVIASSAGAITELLEGAGDLVAPRSVPELAEALIRWVDDPGHRVRIAEAGWGRVRDTASIEVTLAATLAAWAGTLGGRTPEEALALLGRLPDQST